MKNKIIRMVTITLFAVFSFFYTHKTIKLLKDIDPIMKEIKKEKIKYEQPSKNAEIFNDEIIPGYSGIKVDTDKSYIQMKKMNKYNANYYIYKNVSPTISINNNYDKYITKGNYLKNEVSLIFPIKKESTLLQDIYQILENKNIYGTFFIDGIYIKEHNNEIYTLVDDGHEVEVLSYNNNNQKEDIDTARKELKNVINSQGNYCLTNTKDETILEICKNNNMYTVSVLYFLKCRNIL